MSNVAVSVIIPVYNAEKYLEITLDSVMAQTFQNIEIICVDDGSNDGSVQIIENYMKKDSRVKLLFQQCESNSAALARNMGLKEAKGKYVMFLDADDFFEKTMISDALDEATTTNADMVMFNAFVYDTYRNEDIYDEICFNKKIVKSGTVIAPHSIKDKLIQSVGKCPWNKLYKRDYIIRNNIWFQPIRQRDDYEFVVLAAIYANKIAFTDKRYIHYRKDSNNSQTSNYFKSYTALLDSCEHMYDELVSRNLYNDYRHTFINECVGQIIYYLNQMKSFEEYRIFFNHIKERINQIDFLDDSIYEILSLVNLKYYRLIVESNSPEDFLFNITRSVDSYNKGCFKLPYNSVAGKKRIVLYGAGMVGRRICDEIRFEDDICLVAWLDKNYQKIVENKVEAPEKIRVLEYDYVFIAIESKPIQNEVEEQLISLGVEQNKIVKLEKR